jgi:hypothetical protein
VRYYGVQNEVKSYLNRLQSEAGLQVSVSTVKTLNDRVESLKKSGVWSQYGLGFNDADADRYFQRASVNDVLGRFEVCLFVRGMKTLGLWQNMVSWPLRSYQNIGTGSTAYSLGGLGTFDGTLQNNTNWSLSGVYFPGDVTRPRMLVSNLAQTNYSQKTLYVAGLTETGTTADGGERGHFITTWNAPTRFGVYGTFKGMGFGGFTVQSECGDVTPSSTTTWSETNSSLEYNKYHTHALIFNSGSLLAYKNGSFANSNSTFGSPSVISDQGFMFMDDVVSDVYGYSKGYVGFGCSFNSLALNAQQISNLNNLIKSTLGSSLGLP